MTVVAMPHHLDSERAIIGAILLRGGEVFDNLAGLRAADFYHSGLGAAFQAATELHREAIPFDVVLLADKLDVAALQSLGGLEGLAGLASTTGTAETAAYHARLVRDAAARQRLIVGMAEIAERAREGSSTADELSRDVAALLDSCQGAPTEATHISTVLQNIFEAVRSGNQPGAAGVPTSLQVLDGKLTYNGLPRRHVTLFAGKTSEGKSALANTCMLGAALRGMGVLCCTFEDSPDAVSRRLLARISRIQNRQVQRGIIGQGEETKRFREALTELARTRIHFLDRVPSDVTELTASIRRHCRKHHTDLVIVDFLQLLRSSRKHSSRQEQVDFIFGEIVAMARELDAATLVVSQLRRTHEGVPTKEDLYHSGALEQWSHTIGLLWRPELPQFPGLCSLILAKQKNACVGRITLGWDADLVTYTDPDPSDAKRYSEALDRLGANYSKGE